MKAMRVGTSRDSTGGQAMANAGSRGVRWVALALVAFALAAVVEAAGPYRFYPLTPCRVVDTRVGYGGVMTLGTVRTFTIKGASGCGVPTDAQAVSFNVTINQPVMSGRAWLALYPSGTTWPGNSTINFADTDTSLANGAIVPLGSMSSNELSVTSMSKTGTVHLILDVNGYYK